MYVKNLYLPTKLSDMYKNTGTKLQLCELLHNRIPDRPDRFCDRSWYLSVHPGKALGSN